MKTIKEGFCLVVLDQGFIFLGNLEIKGDFGVIKNARCLRRWTSGRGLEWHIEEGGKIDTVIDGKGRDRKFHISKLQNWAKTDEAIW